MQQIPGGYSQPELMPSPESDVLTGMANRIFDSSE
jgi:hypothetical protein